jgi:hypothetical protein
MRQLSFGLLLAAGVAAASTASAQSAPEQRSVVTGRPAVFTVQPYVGYMNFGALNEYQGDVRESFDNRAIYGAQASLALTENFSVIGNFGYAKTRPVLKNVSEATQLPRSGSDVGIWLYDANAEYRLPLGIANGAIRPFVQGGAGAVRYSTEADDIRSSSETSVALNAGVGVDVRLGTVGLRLMAKDYLTSLDWARADDVTFRNRESRRANNIALTAGLTIGF